MSLLDLAANSRHVEVLVAADPDDPATADIARTLGAVVVEAPQRYGYGRLHEYFNLLAAAASGDWLLLWNDDAVMASSAWEQLATNPPDGAVVADLQSQLSPQFCCFPAVHRDAVDATGGVYSPHTPHVDSWWQDIGRAAGLIRPVPVVVHHDRFDLTGNHNDTTYAEGRAGPGLRHVEYFTPQMQALIAEAAQKVRAACAPH